MRGRALRSVSLAFALIGLGSSATAQVQATTVVISGSATASSVVSLLFHAPPAGACGIYRVCGSFATTGAVACSPGDDGTVVATALAAAINSGVAGFSALSNGGALTIVGPPGTPFELCLSAGDTFICGGGSNLDLVTGCTINNVCNGSFCDENFPHTAGLRFTKVATPGVPAVDGVGLVLLAVATVVAAGIALRRRRVGAPA